MVPFSCRLLCLPPARARGASCHGLRWLALAACFLLAGCAARRPAATARSETAERLSEQARQARDRGDLQSAETLLTAAVDRNPGDGETRLELSELLLEHGNSEAAAANLRQLIHQNPDDPRAYVGLAEALFLQHNLNEAEDLLETALELDPRQSRGLLLRGKIARARRHDDGALQDYYRVLAFEPDHVEAKMLIAELHCEHGDSRLAAPLLRSIIETAEAADPRRSQAQWLLGRCYARDERWSDAARALEAGIAGRRSTSRDWYELAETCRRAGDTRGAQAAVTQALRLAPSDPQLLALRAALYDHDRSAGFRSAPVVSSLSHEEPPPRQPQVREQP
ncbi:MAG: tetratricopeptide repeat protein [Deltaproteobacteria bacterium]